MHSRTFFAMAALCLFLLPPASGWSHGLERHYGDPINDHGPRVPSARCGGSPGFSLLLVETTSKAMKRALDEGRRDEVRERAEKLPPAAEELGCRSEALEPPLTDPAREVAHRLAECAARVFAYASDADDTALRTELDALQQLIASMQGHLRESEQK